jgi:hypothetical protein
MAKEQTTIPFLRHQLLLSLSLLAVLCLTCLGAGLLAHLSPVMPSYIAGQLERHRELNGVHQFTAGYADAGEYVLIGQVPTADYSRGGVYFLGASDTLVSIMPWALPPAERALIHNYALGDLTHQELLYFLRSLIEEHHLLQAGGEKTTVVLGLFYGMTRPKTGRRLGDDAVPSLFRRHGFYTFDYQKGIHLVRMGPVERFLRRERIYVNRFLRTLVLRPQKVYPAKQLRPEAYQAEWTAIMGTQWRKSMEGQMRHLEELLDYLQQRKVRTQVIFPPRGTWHEELPFSSAYREMVLPILQVRGVPVTDLTRLLPDSDFGDATHVRYTGQWKLHRIYRDLALRALAEMGTPVQSQGH